MRRWPTTGSSGPGSGPIPSSSEGRSSPEPDRPPWKRPSPWLTAGSSPSPTRAPCARWRTGTPRSSTSRAVCSSPDSRTPTSTRSWPASRCSAATSARSGPSTATWPWWPPTPRTTPTRPGSAAAAGRWTSSPGHPHPRHARRGRAGPARHAHQPGRPRRLGQHPRLPPRGRRPHHPRPGGRPDRAGGGRNPGRHPPGGRHGAGGPPRTPRHTGRGVRRPARRAGAPVLPRRDQLAGRHDRRLPRPPRQLRRLPARRTRGRPARPRRRGPVVGPRTRPGADPRTGGAPPHRPGGPLQRHEREDHAGRDRRELHGRPAGALPRRLRLRHRELRTQLHRTGVAHGGRVPARPRGLPDPLPRAGGPRRTGSARRAHHGPRGQRRQRQPAPPRPPADRPPRRHRPLREPGGGREHPGPVGRARTADGRADHPLPRPRTSSPAVSVRGPPAGRSPARRRQRLVGEQPRSAVGHPRRSQPRRTRRGAGPPPGPTSPARRSSPNRPSP